MLPQAWLGFLFRSWGSRVKTSIRAAMPCFLVHSGPHLGCGPSPTCWLPLFCAVQLHAPSWEEQDAYTQELLCGISGRLGCVISMRDPLPFLCRNEGVRRQYCKPSKDNQRTKQGQIESMEMETQNILPALGVITFYPRLKSPSEADVLWRKDVQNCLLPMQFLVSHNWVWLPASSLENGMSHSISVFHLIPTNCALPDSPPMIIWSVSGRFLFPDRFLFASRSPPLFCGKRCVLAITEQLFKNASCHLGPISINRDLWDAFSAWMPESGRVQTLRLLSLKGVHSDNHFFLNEQMEVQRAHNLSQGQEPTDFPTSHPRQGLCFMGETKKGL